MIVSDDHIRNLLKSHLTSLNSPDELSIRDGFILV